MFKITDYALAPDIAEQIADEVSHYVGAAARAYEEVRALRAELAKERETAEAYRFALCVYRWTGSASKQ